jgi:hypothetical protein
MAELCIIWIPMTIVALALAASAVDRSALKWWLFKWEMTIVGYKHKLRLKKDLFVDDLGYHKAVALTWIARKLLRFSDVINKLGWRLLLK